MIERYTSVCVYRETEKQDGTLLQFFEPIADVLRGNLCDPKQTRQLYGLKNTSLYLANRANVKRTEDSLYLVDWTVEPSTDPFKFQNGYQKLISCQIITTPSIIVINNEYAPLIEKGDVWSCFENYKKSNQGPFYVANYVFATPDYYSKKFPGLLLKASEIDFQTQTIKSNLYVANRIELLEDSLFTHEDIVLYDQLIFPPVLERVLVAEPVQVLTRELINAATWAKVKDITTHNRHNEFKDILQIVASGGFYERLSAQLGLTEDELKKYEGVIQKRFSSLLGSDNEFFKLIEDFIAKDESTQEILIGKLREKLIAEHPNLQKDIELLENQKSTLQNEVNQLQEQILSGMLNVDSLKSEAATYESIVKKSEEKFLKIQEDISDYLSASPFVKKLVGTRAEPNQVNKISSDHSKYYIKKSSEVETEDSCEVLDSFQDVFSSINDNLISIGIESKLSPSLATTLCSSLIPGAKPLCLMGAGARRIIDCFSASVFNRTADYIYLENDATFQEAIESLSGFGRTQVVIVDNILLKSYFWQLVESQQLEGRSVIYMASLSDELKILPKGAFDYVKPILTDLYLNSLKNAQLFGGKLSTLPEFKVEKSRMPSWCKGINLSRSVQATFEQESNLCDLMDLSKQHKNTALLMNLLLPWFVLNDDKEGLLELIQEVQFSLPGKEIENLIENKLP